MRPPRQALTALSFGIAASLILASCASMRRAGKDSTAATPSTPSAFSRIAKFSFTDLLPGPKVPVVKVRHKDLKSLPSGHDRALAFDNQRKHGFWFFGGPVDFKEPTLPEPGSELDGSLLPPKMP